MVRNIALSPRGAEFLQDWSSLPSSPKVHTSSRGSWIHTMEAPDSLSSYSLRPMTELLSAFHFSQITVTAQKVMK